ncbi:hypothetical protein [Chelatococcus reniformis]|uniref:Uncharacterized protein n=1 Tax=Chelatococcus reniformis TaxID=1494448 RepID=A0A916U739_9HYPH|nr:hypothetical protein [Chelatococcus reniformis]GGC62809.1 hypothetical protein GCM10010994_21800 [Chelatococcus reniformis]
MGAKQMVWRGSGVRLGSLALAAVLAAVVPARADMIKDLMGLNPFSRDATKSEALPNAHDDEELSCPRIDVLEGGSSIRRGGSGNETDTLAYQLAFGEMARECRKGPDDSTIIKVGVEIRALLGPAGKPGTFNTPLTVQVRRGDSGVVRRTRQVSISIPAGAASGSATVVEEGIAAPPGNGDLLIEVGLGAASAPAAKSRSSSRH